MTIAIKEEAQVLDNQSSLANTSSAIGSEMQVGISSFASWMLGVGTIIGSMAWLFHGPMIARAGTLASIIAWVLAAICTIPMCLIVMELASMFPAAGGPYVYKYYALKRLIPKSGELLGFLTGWLFWIGMIVIVGCMSNGLVNLLSTSIWGSTGASPIWFGPIVILALLTITTIFNFRPVNQAASINNAFSLLKFLMAASFAAIVFFSPSSSVDRIFQTISPTGCTDLLKNVLSVIMLALTGYGGIELVGCTSSETKNPQTNVPKAMFMTLLAVAGIYTTMCIAVSSAAPYVLNSTKDAMVVINTSNVFANCPSLTGYLAGHTWGNVFTACVVASIVGCGFSILLTTARLGYSMAQTGLFPIQFAELDHETKVPKYALTFQFWCLCAIGIGANLLARTGLFPDAYTFLAETFGFMYAFIALLYGICAISLRYTDPHLARPFRVGKKGNSLIWFLSILTIIIWGYAAFGCISLSNQIAGTFILLLGIPIYGFYRWRKQQ